MRACENCTHYVGVSPTWTSCPHIRHTIVVATLLTYDYFPSYSDLLDRTLFTSCLHGQATSVNNCFSRNCVRWAVLLL
nr:MAG TPA: hypothetical protein [Caudoviricetes sp.]